MVNKHLRVSTGITALLLLSSTPLLKSAEAQQSQRAVPAGYQKIYKQIKVMNAESATFVAKVNALTAKDWRRQMALKAHELDKRGVTGAERQRALNVESARLHREDPMLELVRLGEPRHRG